MMYIHIPKVIKTGYKHLISADKTGYLQSIF